MNSSVKKLAALLSRKAAHALIVAHDRLKDPKTRYPDLTAAFVDIFITQPRGLELTYGEEMLITLDIDQINQEPHGVSFIEEAGFSIETLAEDGFKKVPGNLHSMWQMSFEADLLENIFSECYLSEYGCLTEIGTSAPDLVKAVMESITLPHPEPTQRRPDATADPAGKAGAWLV